tara:strand:- start:89 stop:409 length:321 start_codon:yes stop_codon:yes gene_type:complete
MKKILLFLFLFQLFLSSCDSFKRAVSNTKKRPGDEFLVKKKEPLTMPPSFDELPIPKSSEEQTKASEEQSKISIQGLLQDVSSKTENQNNENVSGDLESSILKKIK